MDISLGGLAFAALILAQFAAVVALHGERKSREPENFAQPQRDIAQASSGTPGVEEAVPKSC